MKTKGTPQDIIIIAGLSVIGVVVFLYDLLSGSPFFESYILNLIGIVICAILAYGLLKLEKWAFYSGMLLYGVSLLFYLIDILSGEFIGLFGVMISFAIIKALWRNRRCFSGNS